MAGPREARRPTSPAVSVPGPNLAVVRILHTSDWHLGRAFYQVRLLDAQVRFVDFLVDLVRAEGVGAVLVSGDVYDRALPSPETVNVLADALTRLVDAGAQVVLTSGNHDSAIRLGFASELLARAGVHIRSSLASIGTPVVFGGEVAVYPLPYLEPTVVGPSLGAEERSHASVVRAAMDRVRADAAGHSLPSIVMAHAFVAGGTTSESEREVAVGGVSVVPADVFDGMTYAALGHLHRPQWVRDNVAYSGSPLAMSFGEADQVKSVALLEVTSRGVSVEAIETPVPRRLAVLRGDLADLLADPDLEWARGAWCRAILTDEVRPLAAYEQLTRRFPDLLSLDFDPRGGGLTSTTRYAARIHPSRPALEVCADFLAHVRGGATATDEEQAMLREALEASRTAQDAASDEGTASGAADVTALDGRGVA